MIQGLESTWSSYFVPRNSLILLAVQHMGWIFELWLVTVMKITGRMVNELRLLSSLSGSLYGEKYKRTNGQCWHNGQNGDGQLSVALCSTSIVSD